MRFGAARLLHYCVDVDAAARENGGETGDNAWPILHHEKQIMFGAETCRYGGRFFVGLRGASDSRLLGSGDCQNVGDHGDRRWVSAGAVAAKDSLATVFSRCDDQVLAAFDPRQGR